MITKEHIKDNLRRLEEFPMVLTMQTRNSLLDETWLFIEMITKENERLTNEIMVADEAISSYASKYGELT